LPLRNVLHQRFILGGSFRGFCLQEAIRSDVATIHETRYRVAVDGTLRRYCAISRNKPRNKVSISNASSRHLGH